MRRAARLFSICRHLMFSHSPPDSSVGTPLKATSMTRSFRIAATFAVTLALALGVAVRLVRADGQATAPAAPAPAPGRRAAPPRRARPGAAPHRRRLRRARLERQVRPAGRRAGRQTAPAGGKAAGDDDYRLDRLPILGIVIHRVYHHYVDPSRIEPEGHGGGGAQRGGAPGRRGHGGRRRQVGQAPVTVGAAKRDFELKDVDTIWKARLLLGEVMGFVQDHLLSHAGPPRDRVRRRQRHARHPRPALGRCCRRSTSRT